jgi:hypothetical protein
MAEIPREEREPGGKKFRSDFKFRRLILNKEGVIVIGIIEFGHA